MSLVVYLAALLLATASILLFRRPRAALRNPLTASTCAVVAIAAICFTCSAPITLSSVNRLTGITNFGAPLTYSLISAYSCSWVILVIQWRGGSPARLRRMTLASIAVYGALIIAIIVLFSLADAHTERLQDLDTYYANTPYMREMIVLYLLGHGICTVVMGVVCLRWMRQVTGPLRTGLRLIIVGLLLDLVGFEIAKITAVVARWMGHDLDFLSTTLAPPVVSLGALACSIGFVLPRLLPPTITHWRSLGEYRSLTPLWLEVGHAATTPKPSPSRWELPHARLQWREVSIHDALLALAPRFRNDVHQVALTRALSEGHPPCEARVIAEAAMLAEAARHADAPEDEAPLAEPGGCRLRTVDANGGTRGLLDLAQALQSPVVAAARLGSVPASRD
ncbi:MAB_1171c family putative transporter [Streptomyces sp. NPDC059371]|uniref:MAB_1171c family putative transporter n=1 Tax=Streptomyces sp. NPDC059371 TaxID=3346812 RepID=UPI003678279C